jgi:hypothetical protein
MRPLVHLLHLATGGALEDEDATPARRAQLAILAILASLAMAAIWGVAAGIGIPALAAHNAYKLPLMLVLAGVGAVPAGLLAWKIVGVGKSSTELLHGYALALFLGCTVLLVLAPLVALYYLSSSTFGPIFALGTAALAMVVGFATFVRVVRARLTELQFDWRALVPSFVLWAAFAATLWQVIALFAPILPERTPLRGGIDDALVQS